MTEKTDTLVAALEAALADQVHIETTPQVRSMSRLPPKRC